MSANGGKISTKTAQFNVQNFTLSKQDFLTIKVVAQEIQTLDRNGELTVSFNQNINSTNGNAFSVFLLKNESQYQDYLDEATNYSPTQDYDW